MNWSDWHKDYESSLSLQARLKIVRAQIAEALDACPPGLIQLVSICSGDGRDVIGALQHHPRRGEVSALLLDSDRESVARGRAAAAAAGLDGRLRWVEADAARAKNYAGAVPADLVLLSGFLGHLRHEDVPRLLENLPMLCKRGGCVIWNRHLLIHQGRAQVPAIRKLFHNLSFEETHYETTGIGGFAVGRVRFAGSVLPLDPARVLFEFVGLDRLLPVPPPGRNGLPEPMILPGDHDEIKVLDKAERSLPECLEGIAALHPARIAVGSGAWQPTHGELNSAANRLAQAFIPRGEPGDRVAVLMRQDAPLVAAILAVLKAGRIVVVLNSADPPARRKEILDEAEARLIVTDAANRRSAAQIAGRNQEIVCFDERVAGPADNPGLSIAPGAVAFLIFTSGSTGRPKGVMQTHRNIIHNVFRLSRGMRLHQEDRLSWLASPGGGLGLSTLWCALLNGAALCPFPMTEKGAASLADWIDEQGITVLVSSASVFRQLMKAVAAEKKFRKVRLVRLASEPASAEDFAAFKSHFGNDCVLLSTLSSSETGNLTQHHLTPKDRVAPGRLPVGFPAEGLEILLRDESGRAVDGGETGEIVVRSRYLSPGYWRNDSLTAQRFSEDPAGVRSFRSGDRARRLPNGSLLFVDRKDTRVKINGYGIEISEIENLLTRQPDVEEAAVCPRAVPAGGTQLVAYVVPRYGKTGLADSLRHALRQQLPGYMVPAHFVFLDRFPVTPQGKMDRAALPPPPENHKTLRRRDRPRDLIETRLTQIWESALGLSPVGRHDDFFDLGGTSLQSVEILLAIEEAFAVSLPASVLAEYSTVERLAALIAGQVMIPSPSPRVLLRRARGGRPLFFIHSGQGEVTTYIPLARRLTARPIYGLQSVGLQGECWPLTSVPAMARRFLPEILAADPAGPYLLAATCMGGLVAFELAQMLVRQGRKVGLLGLMDTHFPLPLTRHEPAWRKVYVAARTPVHETWRRLRWRILRALGAGRNDCLLPAYRRFIANINGRAGRLYRPNFYPGNITLFITAEIRFPAHEDPRLMMCPLAQTARVVKLPGKRSGLFMKPAVDELARQLQNALDRAEAGEWRQPAARERVTLPSRSG